MDGTCILHPGCVDEYCCAYFLSDALFLETQLRQEFDPNHISHDDCPPLPHPCATKGESRTCLEEMLNIETWLKTRRKTRKSRTFLDFRRILFLIVMTLFVVPVFLMFFTKGTCTLPFSSYFSCLVMNSISCKISDGKVTLNNPYGLCLASKSTFCCGVSLQQMCNLAVGVG